MITKEMLAKCQNELGQAYQFLPDDVKMALATNTEHVERFNGAMWLPYRVPPISFHKAEVYRLSGDTPVAPEQNWVDEDVYKDGLFWVVGRGSMEVRLSIAQSFYHFLGIVYEKDGKETLHTSVDSSFGTPKRVRFLR